MINSTPNQAMQLTTSKPDVYAGSVCDEIQPAVRPRLPP